MAKKLLFALLALAVVLNTCSATQAVEVRLHLENFIEES